MESKAKALEEKYIKWLSESVNSANLLYLLFYPTKRLDTRAEEKLLLRVERKRAIIKFEITQMTTWPSKVLRPLSIKNTGLLTELKVIEDCDIDFM